MESAAERGPVKTLRNGRGRGVGPVACARGCSGLARLDTIYLIGPSILTCRITGLFGTASERQILMAGVRGRLEKGRQAGIRQLHHDVAAARHKGNNRGKARLQPPPARSGGKERDEKGPSRLAPSGYLGGGHLKWPGRRYPVGGGGGSPSGHMSSGQTRGVSGGHRISCPGSAPPWLPCRSPLPGCRARRGAPARCPGYPPDTPWCSGRGAWRGFAGTWR